MKSNGLIVCFQKYNADRSAHGGDTISPMGPICLGYFGRVDIKAIDHFSDYVREASRHESERKCSRKQLLLHRISCGEESEEQNDFLHNQVDFLEAGKGVDTDYFPFVATNGTYYGMACCSVFSIRSGECENCKENDVYQTQKLAQRLYREIESLQDSEKSNFRFAILELLGTEDLCLFVLSNQYAHISQAVSKVQELYCNEGNCQKCHVDNVHSILMLDRDPQKKLAPGAWKIGDRDATAEIHFSLQEPKGIEYLHWVKNQLEDEKIGLNDEEKAGLLVEPCSGEYDAILHCPARLLQEYLMSKGGFISIDNANYQASAYQSETFLRPFGREGIKDVEYKNRKVGNCAMSKDEDLEKVVLNAVAELKTIFGVSATLGDRDFDCLELPLWRLLKDYRSFASFPLKQPLHDDLRIQFTVAVNAVVEEARKCKKNNDGKRFLFTYEKIVDAMTASMQTGSQQDRWNFGEQQSHIQNVDSYYKILLCYYGMIKDMTTLLYSIPRIKAKEQPLLIPLISFGINPNIKSDYYNSTLEGKKVRLVCIQMPYQALANPPKYLGVLAHEIYHYATPANRAERNELVIKGLIRVALTEFFSLLAREAEYAEQEEYDKHFLGSDSSDLEFFEDLIEETYSWVLNSLKGTEGTGNKPIERLTLSDIQQALIPQVLAFNSVDPEKTSYQFYFFIWKNLRNNMKANIQEASKQELKMFALDAESVKKAKMLARTIAKFEENADSQETVTEIAYRQLMKNVGTQKMRRFRRLLSNVLKAMEECPADIFDLEVVMAGKTSEEKIRQFLWQIHGTKRAFLTMDMGKNPSREEELPLSDYAEILGANDIRIGMILTFYLQAVQEEGSKSQRKDIEAFGLTNYLKETLLSCIPQNGEYSEKLRNTLESFVSRFEKVNERFFGLFAENCRICCSMRQRVQKMGELGDCKKAVRRLTTFYERYYHVLDERQKSGDEYTYRKNHFYLCCDLISAYQHQEKFAVALPGNSLRAEDNQKETVLGAGNVEPWEGIVRHSAALSFAVGNACKRMAVNGEIPVLWYRGQRKWDWKTLPNIMRMSEFEGADKKHFRSYLKEELRWAKAHILPTGIEFSDAEWLAFLQHYGFKTNTLDFSEVLYPALYFATEKWEDAENNLPDADAALMVFNPVLFNLVMEAFETGSRFEKSTPGNEEYQKAKENREKAGERLKSYLQTGICDDEPPLFAGNVADEPHGYLYKLDSDEGTEVERYPRAVLVPRHCDRMEKQSGEFVYYPVSTSTVSDPEKAGMCNYSQWSLEKLHEKYESWYKEGRISTEVFTPFLYRIKINRLRYHDFKIHLQAIGMREFSVYPEFDKLANDLSKQIRIMGR